MGKVEATVVLSKCSSHNRTFGMRIERRGGDWISTWAFKIDDSKAKKEGFDKTKIKGSFAFDPEYPGCPYCGTYGFVQCGTCGKLSCMTAEATSVRCHWCNTLMTGFESSDSFEVSSGGR